MIIALRLFLLSNLFKIKYNHAQTIKLYIRDIKFFYIFHIKIHIT